MAESLDFVQVCPYDIAPFRDICRAYAAAARLLGWHPRTVFLHAPDSRTEVGPAPAGANGDDRYYMSGPDDPAGLAYLGSLQPERLCVFHRYRSLRIARRAGLRAPNEVLVAHEFGFLQSAWRTWRLRWLERGVRLAGVSPAVARELNTDLVLPNALIAAEQDQTRVARSVARQHLGVGEAEFVVGVLGRLHRKKNVELALRGFAEFAAAQSQPVRLLLLGDGPEREKLSRLADTLNVPVRFAGFVPEASRYLQALDLVLIPAAEVEAFGMVALEALLAEVPVVCSQAPGPVYVLGERAVYYDSDTPQAVAGALTAAQRAPRTGRERALLEFSPAALAQRLQALVR